MKLAILAPLAVAALAGSANAAILYSSDFNSASGYVDGGIIGQDGWAITGSSTVAPIAVSNTASNGVVRLASTGQDVFHGFTAQTSGSVYMTADITILTAGAFDYFIHLGDGGSSNFAGRLYVRTGSVAGTFQMAMSTGASATNATLVWGADLNIGTSYNIMARYDIVAGTLNDTGAVFVNPTNTWGIGDTAYTTALTTGADIATISSVNLRQGTATNNVSAIIDNLVVQTIPTPGSAALLGVGLLAAGRRRRA